MNLHTADILSVVNYSNALNAAHELSINVDQDFEVEMTTYVFKDGSALTDSNGELNGHFSVDSISHAFNSEKSDAELDYELDKIYA